MDGETAKSYIQNLLEKAAKDLNFNLSLVTLSVPESRFGDYASNAGLVGAKKLGKNPKELAEKIIKELKKGDAKGVCAEISSAGGFINFHLHQNYLAGFAEGLVKKIGISQIGKARKVVFEYSSPNTNKPLHIGHTRNDVYGLACINLLKALGYNVISCEIINDRGIHIMKSVLMYIKNGEGKTPESENIKPDHFVGKFYLMFSEQASKSEQAEKQLLLEAQELLQKWEAGDKDLRKLWKQMNDWWYEGVKATYEREGSYFDEVDYESEIYDKGRDLVLDGVKQGVFTKEADGSVAVDLSADSLDKKYLLRKDGTTLYITQDMYLWHMRDEKHHPELALVTTSAEQAYHFRVLKRIFESLKYSWAQNFKHLPYEHVFLGHDKMSSRAGNTISADDLLIMIKEKVKTAMAGLQKIKQSSTNDELVEQVAFAAIKYGYLKYEPNTRIYFDVDQTIALEGNTGPYLQYAYSRIQSIIKKAGNINASKPEKLTKPEELALMRHLLHYSETIEHAGKEYKPNLLCNYLYELAAKFNAFYSHVPVIAAESDELKHQRLTLLTAVGNVLHHGLNILGIAAPEEM